MKPRNQKQCVICGAPFFAPPSSKKVTCSAECRSKRAAKASAANRGKRVWSPEKAAKRKADPLVKAQITSIQPSATAKAMENPINQRGPQNKESKVWTLYPPDSRTPIVVVNLSHWARENYDLFEPGSDDIEASARRIRAGFQAIAQTLAGKRGYNTNRRGAASYKGWTMLSLPKDKEDQP